VIDAAYSEYVTEADYEPGIDLVRAHDNVVMTRTFSKIFALGGLRIGWSYSSAEIADIFNRLRNPFNVSAAAQAAGVAAIQDRAFIEQSVAHNARWRDWMRLQLNELGLPARRTFTNFALPRFPEGPAQADAAWEHLKRDGILGRRVGSYGLPDHLRITIGTEEEMRAVITSLTGFVRT
jgi:histidinol-phosphate aminotransferase